MSNDLKKYIFGPSPEDKFTWRRQCYGFESYISAMADNANGYPTPNVSVNVTPAYDRAIMEPMVKSAWISLRHSLPAIAVKSSRLPAPDNHYILNYHIPKDLEEVKAWADETVCFDNEVKGMYTTNQKLSDERLLLPGNGNYVGELYVSPAEVGWILSILFNHNSIDGRSLFGILNELLHKLVMFLEDPNQSISELCWGEETKRLPPAAIVLSSRAETSFNRSHPPSPLLEKSWWTWTPVRVAPPNAPDRSILVTFPAKATSKLHAISKMHGQTIGNIIAALSVLAHTEGSLAIAAKSGPEQFRIVSQSYKESEVYRIPFSLGNYRLQFPKPYNDLLSETPGPLAAFDAFPLLLSMEPVRKFFRITDENVTTSVGSANLSDAFWNGLVKATANSWKDYDFSLQGYAARERSEQQKIHNFNPDIIHVPNLVFSSVGDLGRLNILKDYLPSKQNPTLTVSDLVHGQRTKIPMISHISWTFDGKFNSHWFTGGEWMTEEGFQLMVDSFKRWMEIFIILAEPQPSLDDTTGTKSRLRSNL